MGICIKIDRVAVIVKANAINNCVIIYCNNCVIAFYIATKFGYILNVRASIGRSIACMKCILTFTAERNSILISTFYRPLKFINICLILSFSNRRSIANRSHFQSTGIFPRCISCPNPYVVSTTDRIFGPITIFIFENEFSGKFFVFVYCSLFNNLPITNNTIHRCINLSRSCVRSCESSRWNESERKRCHRYQRHNLLRDLIQLYSLPINFLRNLAPPQWGAGLFSLHPAWSVPHFSCRSRFAIGKTSRQNKKPSAFAGLAARFRPVRPRPRQRLRPGLVESSRLGDMLWLYSPFR